ncbi:MAG TPA: hypothetical protein VNE59_06215 [Burkholderiales bacterium]|nr:hypothetical protein [Burkholderiales bacterium]
MGERAAPAGEGALEVQRTAFVSEIGENLVDPEWVYRIACRTDAIDPHLTMSAPARSTRSSSAGASP